jgi:hypothetical protein
VFMVFKMICPFAAMAVVTQWWRNLIFDVTSSENDSVLNSSWEWKSWRCATSLLSINVESRHARALPGGSRPHLTSSQTWSRECPYGLFMPGTPL